MDSKRILNLRKNTLPLLKLSLESMPKKLKENAEK